MRVIEVKLEEKKYNIYVGNRIVKEIPKILSQFQNNKLFIITDDNVKNLYLDLILKTFDGFNFCIISFMPGEKNKSLETVSGIYNKLIDCYCDRKDLIVALGGGLVGDIAGFTASTYMRGIDYIQIPTTLLAQVDSSVGGKTGVNFRGFKNIIGSFYQPKVVFIDIQFLNTLKDSEINSGLGEIFKYGLIKDYTFFDWVDNNINSIKSIEKEAILYAVNKSLMIKKEIVEKDEKESNLRRVLNFGHTIGHGIESLNGIYKYTHGESVILGMIYESYIAKKMGLIDQEYFSHIINTLSTIVKPPKFSEKEVIGIIENISHDKKATNNKNIFVLPVGKGKVEIYEGLEENFIAEVLKGEF